jgi:hypothetical protein
VGDGVNIAARLEGICEPGAICLSEDAYRQVKGRLDLAVTDLGQTQLKNIVDPVRVYALEVGEPARAKPTRRAAPKQRSILLLLGAGIIALIRLRAAPDISLAAPRPPPSGRVCSTRPRQRIFPWWCCPSPTSRAIQAKIILPMA